MRTWLILLALVALVCAGTSHQNHGASRNRRNLVRSRQRQGSLRADEEVAAVGAVVAVEHPEQHHDHHSEPGKEPDHGEVGNGEQGEAIVLKGEEAKEKARLARKIVYQSNGTVLGTHGTSTGLTQYALVNGQLVTDVIEGKSTGVPYVYIRKEDFSEKDLEKNEHATALFSRVSINNSCNQLPLNGIDPKCVRAALVGKLKKVEENSEEHKAACKELIKKFPGLKELDQNKYVLRKMDVEAVFVVDHEGRVLIVPMEYYNKVDPEDVVLAGEVIENVEQRRPHPYAFDWPDWFHKH